MLPQMIPRDVLPLGIIGARLPGRFLEAGTNQRRQPQRSVVQDDLAQWGHAPRNVALGAMLRQAELVPRQSLNRPEAASHERRLRARSGR